MIWKKLATLILKNRLSILFIVLGLSAFMGFEASKVRLTYNAGKILPVTDSAYINYIKFRKMFGEDATAMVLGVKSPNLFQQNFFNDWYRLGNHIQKIQGIKGVVSLANIYKLQKDTAEHKFVLKPLITDTVTSQKQVDSVKNQVYNMPFY